MIADNRYHLSFPPHYLNEVKYPFGVKKTVRNFGWLHRHARDVSHILVVPIKGIDENRRTCLVTAKLHGGAKYEAVFEDYRLLWPLLHRPVFENVQLQWGSKLMPIRPLAKGQRWEDQEVPTLDMPLTVRAAVGY